MSSTKKQITNNKSKQQTGTQKKKNQSVKANGKKQPAADQSVAGAFNREMREAKDLSKLRSRIAVIDGTTPATLQYAGSMIDIIAMCQYALVEVLRKYPGVFDYDSANISVASITPSGFVAYNVLAFVQKFADLKLLSTSVPATTCFPTEAPVLTCIAELIRGYVQVVGCPNLSRTLTIPGDLVISNSSVTPYVAGSPTNISVNQFPTGTGLESLCFFARDIAQATMQTYYDYTLDTYNKNYTGVFDGSKRFVESPEFNEIVSWLSKSKISTVPYDKINDFGVDYTGFCFPNTGNPDTPGVWWNNSTSMNCPSKYFDPDYAPVFTPSTGVYSPPRSVPAPLYTAAIVNPSFSVRGQYAGNVINNAIVPPGQTKLSEAYFKFYSRTMVGEISTTTSYGPLFKTKTYALHGHIVRLSKMIGVSIDTCGLISDMITAVIFSLGKKEIGVAFAGATLNIIYCAAQGVLMRRVVSHMPDLFQCLGATPAVCIQTLLPEEIYNALSMHPYWSFLIDSIGPVVSGGYGFYPVVSQIATSNSLNSNNSVAMVKFASLILANDPAPRASAYGQYHNQGQGTYAINFPDAFIGNFNGGAWNATAYPLPTGMLTVATENCFINSNTGNGNFQSSIPAPYTVLQFGSQNWSGDQALKNVYDAASFIGGTGVKKILSFWCESGQNFMMAMQAILDTMGTDTLGIACKPKLYRYGWSNMFSNSYRLLDFDGQSNSVAVNIVTISNISNFVVQNANAVEYKFVESKFGFMNHMSSAKLYNAIRVPLSSSYYAGNATNLIQGMPYEKSLYGNNIHALSTDFIAKFSSRDGVVMREVNVQRDKRKFKQCDFDGALTVVSATKSIEAPDNSLDVAVKKNSIAEADPSDRIEHNVADLTVEAKSLASGDGEHVPKGTMQIKTIEMDNQACYTADDFNWKKTLKTTAKVGGEICAGLVMLL